jgi:hypothetical protein
LDCALVGTGVEVLATIRTAIAAAFHLACPFPALFLVQVLRLFDGLFPVFHDTAPDESKDEER